MATTATEAKSATPTTSKDKPAQVSKPERPDEEAYKAELAKAEKEFAASQERMVSLEAAWQVCKKEIAKILIPR